MTIAQIKQQRQLQLRKIIAVLRTYDGRQEAFERLLKRYRSKRKLIESDDFPALVATFRAMNDNFNAVETELTNLGRLLA